LKSFAKFELFLVTGTYSVSKEQRQRLAFAAHVTNAATHSRLTSGSIVTMDGHQHLIKLSPIYPTIVSTVDELRKICGKEVINPPRVFLNAHCPLCPYCDPCRQKAEEEDSLSQLGRMSQKIIRRYEKKGIFTVKQLSYVFNPRRRRKKSVVANSIFNLELQALAIRTEKIYLNETPLIPTNQVELFLDIEGIPDQGFYYLIRILVVHQAEIQDYSFWADTKVDELAIFQDCLRVAARYEAILTT
jgi:predicted RecB family nuclease